MFQNASRTPRPNDFVETVEGVGQFTFGRRTMADETKFQVAFARIIDGAPPTEWLQIMGSALADLQVMTVRAPEGWDLNTLDPLDPETEGKLLKVHKAYRDKEHSFRSGNVPRGARSSAGAGADNPVPVSPEVQPGA